MKKIQFKINSEYVYPTLASDFSKLSPLTDNPLESLRTDPGMGSIIHSWGFIGDSLASGSLEGYIGGQHSWGLMQYDWSWGQRLMKLLGTEGYNYSVGSQTCGGWIGNYGESSRRWEGARTTPKDAYIIAMGVNDINGSDTNPRVQLGAPSDIKDNYEDNASTFYGQYAGIIQRIRSISQRCHVFVVTNPRWKTTNVEWNNAIKYMVDKFDKVWLIDLAEYMPFSSNTSSDWYKAYWMGSHMTPAGYQWCAYVFNTYIDWIIRKNYSSFKDVGYLNSELEPF